MTYFQIHFLSAADGTGLTKRFDLQDGQLVKHPYPQVAAFTSHAVEVETVEDLFVQLMAHGDAGHCVLKGQLDRALKNESRADHTNSDTTTEWMVLDNDHLHDLEPQALMDLLGLGDVDHIVQYSASAGIVPGKMGYHIFFLLDRPWLPADLKLVLRAWNLDHPEIKQHFHLSRTYNSLRWPLDISVCQNDKLIYITPPTLGLGVDSTLEGERIRLVRGSRRAASLTPAAETEDLLRQRENTVLNQLRIEAGLPQKAFDTRTDKGEIVVAKNPDQAQVTGHKEERGFRYLNLNGGDSWGYYHPITSPEVLFNFKDEPNYLIQELLPDYYPQALARANEAREAHTLERQRADIDLQNQRIRDAEANGKPFLVAFRDKKTDKYYAGWIDPEDQSHDLDAIGTKERINDLCKQYGIPKIKTIPSGDFRFDPANDELYDLEAGFINRYEAPSYFRNAKRRDGAAIPPAIRRVLRHALGDDPQVVEHFINWLTRCAVLRTQSGVSSSKR